MTINISIISIIKMSLIIIFRIPPPPFIDLPSPATIAICFPVFLLETVLYP
jgi:hypothetical protein